MLFTRKQLSEFASYLTYTWFPPPPKYMGGEIFLDPHYLGVICSNFLNRGGKNHLGGTDDHLGGINLNVIFFNDMFPKPKIFRLRRAFLRTQLRIFLKSLPMAA